MNKRIFSLTSVLILLTLIYGCGSRKQASRQTPPVGTPRTTHTYNSYIDRYSDIALESQRKFKIPASITLAQGLLESGAGNSSLARNANNHFGIKCHRSWTGGRTYHTDDAPNECFRSYNSVRESYEDHGYFLSSQKRYSGLFRLSPTDYKGWAKGLQSAGYATDKGYANKLIKIIEDYRLYLVDESNISRDYAYNKPKQPKKEVRHEEPRQYKKPATKSSTPAHVREVFRSYGLLYILADANDDLGSIARDFDISERKLTNYNDFPEGYPLKQGDIVYLQRKLKRAEPPHYEHVVQVGESIHEIAQKYGLQLSALYRLNSLTSDYYPEEGDILRLR